MKFVSCFQSVCIDASLFFSQKGSEVGLSSQPCTLLPILLSFSCHGRLSMSKVFETENYTPGPND